jgi:hypothetical protein
MGLAFMRFGTTVKFRAGFSKSTADAGEPNILQAVILNTP